MVFYVHLCDTTCWDATAKKRAVIAVARRLAVLLLALWKTGEVYEPLRNAMAREAA